MHQLSSSHIWVRSWRCCCLVTWFCYQMIAKPGNKTAAVSWPDLYVLCGTLSDDILSNEIVSIWFDLTSLLQSKTRNRRGTFYTLMLRCLRIQILMAISVLTRVTWTVFIGSGTGLEPHIKCQDINYSNQWWPDISSLMHLTIYILCVARHCFVQLCCCGYEEIVWIIYFFTMIIITFVNIPLTLLINFIWVFND